MEQGIRKTLKDRYKILLICILLFSIGLRSAAFFTPHNGFDEVVYLKLAEKTYHNPIDYTLRGTDILTNYRIRAFGQYFQNERRNRGKTWIAGDWRSAPDQIGLFGRISNRA